MDLDESAETESGYAIEMNDDFIRKTVVTKAKDGTVKEVWLAADRAFRKAKKLYGDWHYFLEIVELKTDSCRRKNGYIASFYGS